MKHLAWSLLTLLFMQLTLSMPAMAQEKKPPFPDEPGRPPMMIGPEMEQVAFRFLETYHPSRADELKRIKMIQPERYRRMIVDIFQRAERLRMFQKEDPERYELEVHQETIDEKTFSLAQAYRNTKDEKEKQNFKQQLESTVSEHFDVREQIKESELKRMESDLQRLKERLKQRKASKSEVVKQRVNQLMTIGSGLEWD